MHYSSPLKINSNNSNKKSNSDHANKNEASMYTPPPPPPPQQQKQKQQHGRYYFKLLVKMQLTQTTPHAYPLFSSLITYAQICKIFHSRLKINLYHTNRQSKWVHVTFSYLSQGSNSDTEDDTTALVEDSCPAPPDILQVADKLLPSISNLLSIEDGDTVR